MASIRVTLRKSTKGGPGSGNWGHSGRQGLVGGSALRGHSMSIRSGQDWQKRYEAKTGRKPAGEVTPKKDPDQEKLQQYFEQNSRVSNTYERVKMMRLDTKRAQEDAWKYRTSPRAESYRQRANEMQSNLNKEEQVWKDEKKKLADLAKGTKAPAYGEWRKVEGPASKRAAGSSVDYQVPGRPELGTVTIYRFSGWSMQKVAPHASVTYGNSSFEWHGQGAVESAKNFMNKLFGATLY